MSNATQNIWGTMAVDAVSIAYAAARGDMTAALVMATGAAAVEYNEKQLPGEMFADDEWASL